jgi:hypothetical protein
MEISELLYAAAYCVFLAGAAKSFRDNGSRESRWIMGCAVAADFLVSMLPMLGVDFLKMDLEGHNAAITLGIVLGFAVWLLFIAALIARKKGSGRLYHAGITMVEITWFLDFIIFLYGIYKFPLT